MKYRNLFKLYGKIPKVTNANNLFQRLFYSLPRYIMRFSLSRFFLPIYYKNKSIICSKKSEDTIVSLTSFPVRIDTIWLCIESLKHQSVKPAKIILYLSKDQFKGLDLPKSLLNEIDENFEIRMVDGDIRSHKKYYYAIQEFEGKNIVTCDDDVIYPPTMLECLLKCHSVFPNDVIANNTHLISLNKDYVLPYSQWRDISSNQLKDGYCTLLNQIQVGVGGVLYPPNVLYKDVLNIDLAKDLAFMADDLWLYSQTVLSNRKVVKTNFNMSDVIPIPIKGDITLSTVNCSENKNDIQFNAIREFYLQNICKDIVSFK